MINDYNKNLSPLQDQEELEQSFEIEPGVFYVSAWYRHNIAVELAIPVDQIRQLNNEKLQKFLDIRLPKSLEQIEAKRTQYTQLMDKIKAKNKLN